uniref:Uncharacterized protein n=1 Tax=Heterorhabditis bacteriophora TaxID=37862 RepID=A0A1I7XCV3_HETBA
MMQNGWKDYLRVRKRRLQRGSREIKVYYFFQYLPDLIASPIVIGGRFMLFCPSRSFCTIRVLLKTPPLHLHNPIRTVSSPQTVVVSREIDQTAYFASHLRRKELPNFSYTIRMQCLLLRLLLALHPYFLTRRLHSFKDHQASLMHIYHKIHTGRDYGLHVFLLPAHPKTVRYLPCRHLWRQPPQCAAVRTTVG